MDFLVLFATSLLAATIVPMSSEAALAAIVAIDPGSWVAFLAVASVGNILGSVINYFLGRAIAAGRASRWFPVSPEAIDKASQRFARFGTWSLLLAWVPWIGDPLTVAAGLLRVPLWIFVVLVGTGKVARYLVVVLSARELVLR